MSHRPSGRMGGSVWGLVAAAALVAALAAPAPAQSSGMAGDEEVPAPVPATLDLSFLADPQQGAPSWIVAKVNDEIVTRHEVLQKIESQLLQLRQTYEGEAYRRKALELWEKTLSDVVEERVLLQVARKEGIEITWKEVDKAMDEEIKRAGSRERFDQNLLQTGMTLDDYRNNSRNQLTMRDLIYRRVGIKEPKDQKKGVLAADPIATPREIHAYYDEHKDEFYLEEKVLPQQIVLRFADDAGRRSTMDLARSLERQIKAGADFDALAVWYSKLRAEEAGRGDWTPRGSLPPELEDRIFAMKASEISSVLESGNTLRIIRVLSRQDARQQSFAEVQEEIKKRIQNKRIFEQIEKVKGEIFHDNYIWPPDVIKKRSKDKR